MAKAVLTKAIKQNPHSVRLWLEAAGREEHAKKLQVLRKALEFIPNSVRLWKEAISREEEDDARIMLSRAVECVPHSVEMWLALAKLSSYKDAQKVLNEARKHVPTAPQIWVTAAQLEETQGNDKMVDLILSRALDSLSANGVTADRDAWIKHGEEAEKNGYTKTCNSIVKCSIRIGLEDADAKLFKQTVIGDAEASLARGAVETARAIYTAALGILKAKKGLWLRLADLEMKHGNAQSLDDVLSRAVSFCPNAEILWLMAAKQKWIHGDVSAARQILAEAFTHSKDSEAIHLAAIKLENENNEIQRARLLLMRSRMQCDTPKIWMQSVQLEREQGEYETAIKLSNEAIQKHGGSHPKLWMILGQCYEEIQPPQLDDAAKAFDKGIQNNPRNVFLWLCAAECARKAGKLTKARAILEKARVQLPNNEFLWLGGVDVETAASNEKVATHLMSRALQECPNAGVLWSRAIELEPKASQNAKSVDALKKCENDTYVIVAVAKLFWKDMKTAKARKWFNRAVSLNAALGDAWGAYLAFELACGSVHEQRDLIQRFAETQPNQGITWNPVAKQTKCWRMKWPQKMLTFLEIHYPKSLDKIDEGIMALLSGEEEKMEEPEEKDEDMKQEDEADDVERDFIAAKTFGGPKSGFVFKSGPRGVGYYRDATAKKEIVKKEKKEEP
jgi:pre-mRNA-processing factor 6